MTYDNIYISIWIIGYVIVKYITLNVILSSLSSYWILAQIYHWLPKKFNTTLRVIASCLCDNLGQIIMGQ